MDEETAGQVIQIADHLTAELNELVRLVRDSGLVGPEYQRFRRVVGGLMGEIYLELLKPIYDTFPHLTPSSLIPGNPEAD